MFELRADPAANVCTFTVNGKTLIAHAPGSPAVFLGAGAPDIRMHRGNFEIEDRLLRRFPLTLSAASDRTLTFTHPALAGAFTLTAEETGGLVRVRGSAADQTVNRLWLRFPAETDEHVTGGGEQFSCLDLRGRRFPIWTREQGVGRNKATEVTRLADESDGGGGDYHTTFYPQPTFVSSNKYFAHIENYEYAALDFTAAAYHEIELWTAELSLVLGTAESYASLVSALTGLLGRQPVLPDWAMQGLWLGVQGGTDRACKMRDRLLAGGADVSAVWIQDWEGRRVTSFGKRLQWDWRWNPALYPGLDAVIKADGRCRWMGYINPCLVEDGALFAEAREKGYLVKNAAGEDYLFDCGEFNSGAVDLTLPAAFSWYKNVIKTNLIGMGFRGWMADFGEYLPADAVCAGGGGASLHNRWPVLWAKCNREAVEESGLSGDCVFFMRSGGAGSGRYSTLTWAGDQNVDWSADDGLPSVVTAALTLGMSGFGLHTCDAGGYTTLFHLKRTGELLMRWLEFAAFTPVMRTHEGNRPDTNAQVYDTTALVAFTAKMTRLHTALLPYIKAAAQENAETGVPVMRPLFFVSDAPEAWDRENYAYLLGNDVLVAPVTEPGAAERRVWLPAGEWTHLWTNKTFTGGTVTVPAPLGQPPVFYRPASPFAGLLRMIGGRE